MNSIFIKAISVTTRKTDRGYSNYITTVTSDRPLFRQQNTNWDAGSLNSRMQDAINTLLIEFTGAGGQSMGFCANRYPQPNSEGLYEYKFESYCDHSG